MMTRRVLLLTLLLVACRCGSARAADAPDAHAAATARCDLADAAEKGDEARVRALLADHADPNATQVDGTTALHWAAYRDDLEVARLLLAARAGAGSANRYGVTPL